MSADIRIKNIRDIKSFEDIRPQWEILLSKSGHQSAFLTWEWLYSWWKATNTKRKLWLITAWRDEQVVGIAPLMLETRNSLLKVLTNLGTPQIDVGGFIHNPNDQDVVKTILEHLVANRSYWDILELNEFPKSWIEQFGPKEKFPDDRFWTLENHNKHFYMQLDAGSWEKYSEKLASKFRYNLRRATRLAEELGPVKLHHYQGKQVNWKIFETIIEINRYANHPKLYNSQNEQSLIRELIEQMGSEQNCFNVYILSVNHEPVAYEYGFSCQRRFEDWRSGFDTRLPSNVSIGKVLAMKVVQDCISEKYLEIDFLRGDEAYKQEWIPNSHDFTKFRVFNKHKPMGALAYFWLTNIKPQLDGDRKSLIHDSRIELPSEK